MVFTKIRGSLNAYRARPRPPLRKSGMTSRGALGLIVLGPCVLVGSVQQVLFGEGVRSRSIGAGLMLMAGMVCVWAVLWFLRPVGKPRRSREQGLDVSS